MVVSPCTTFTLPENVASFFLSRISSEAASIWIGWSQFREKPCMALGTPCAALCAPASPHVIIARANAAALRAKNIRLKSLRVGKDRFFPGIESCALTLLL